MTYRLRFFLLSVALAIFISVVLAVSARAQARRVLLGYSSLSSNQTPVWVAKDEGFFKKFGLDAEMILIEGGTRGAQGIISGDVPVMAMAGQPVISARARGSDMVLIGGIVNKMNYILATTQAIKKPEDLKGKRVGITQIGSSSYHAVVLALKHWGMDPRRDKVTMLQVGNQAARVASLQTGGSDAVIVNPGLAEMLKKGGFNVLADFTELPIPYPQDVLAVREQAVRGNPDLFERILKGVAAGCAFTLDPRNKEKVKAVLMHYLRLQGASVAEEQYQSALKVIPRKPYVDVKGISAMIEFMQESDPLVSKVKAADVIDETILKKLDASGFLDQLYKK